MESGEIRLSGFLVFHPCNIEEENQESQGHQLILLCFSKSLGKFKMRELVLFPLEVQILPSESRADVNFLPLHEGDIFFSNREYRPGAGERREREDAAAVNYYPSLA